MLIVDAHLDLAYNTTRHRDPRQRAELQPIAENEMATVGFPNLLEGNVALVCSTIFCSPAGYGHGGYSTAEEARDQALVQLDWYREVISQGLFDFVTAKSHEIFHRGAHATKVNGILLLEGGDAFRLPADVKEWFDWGLRIVGLAWRRTRMAGGTGQPGPLTDEGRRIVRELDQFGIIHDVSHLAEESFWELLHLSNGPVIASHSNCRSIVPTDRQLSDEMIKAIAARGGVIGINFYDKFLMPPDEYGTRRCNLGDLVRHVKHITDLLGNANHVGLGSDMDGGLGREQIPHEIVTSSGLPRIAGALSSAGYSDEDVAKIMGENWLRYFSKHLPGTNVIT
jgi:membrane dipeptidase